MNRRHLPMFATALVLAATFLGCGLAFEHFFSLRVVVNLFTNYAHIGVIAVGMTFVILAGSIDLSVGAVLGFTTILVATLVTSHGIPPALAIPLALLLGTAFGAGMGALIQVFQLPAFLVTLAGMFLARGLAFGISPESVGITHPFFTAATDFGIPLTDRVSLGAPACLFLLTLGVGLLVARRTAFGRNVHAVGGSESSALLMGLPVARTRVAVHALCGFCAALGGVVFTLQTQSGNAAHGQGVELDAIAAVVIGGTALTGGVGHLAGTLMGVLVTGVILTAISFHGGLDSSWQRIAVGLLLLAFILLQRGLSRLPLRSRYPSPRTQGTP